MNEYGDGWDITQLQCEKDLYFSPHSLKCTIPDNIEACSFKTTTTTTTSTTTTTTTITTSMDQNDICKKPGLNPGNIH